MALAWLVRVLDAAAQRRVVRLAGAARWSIVESWWREVVVQGWRFNFAVPSNQSLYGALARTAQWRGAAGAAPYRPVAALGAGWLFGVGHASRRAFGPAAHPAAAAAGVWCVLGAKLSWVVHFALAAFAVAVAPGGTAQRRAVRVGVTVFAVCTWSSFQLVPSALRTAVETWSLFAVAGLGIMLSLTPQPRTKENRA